MLRNINIWISEYLKQLVLKNNYLANVDNKTLKILFTICDHYEPYWENKSDSVAYNRVNKWVTKYQEIASRHKDSIGSPPKHNFFYPIEEYKSNLLEMIAEICHNGFGEVEIHLHHNDDNSENLRKTLLEFKDTLVNNHGLLPKNKKTAEIMYAFIHGDWALDNSRPDGKCCGVNDELTILQETGCYADFTMPSAPSDTQTKTINSIYYAVDDPKMPKSHDTGEPASAGKKDCNGLLCIQGPLALNLHYRKFGIIPRIENGCFAWDTPVNIRRAKIWMRQHIHVKNRPDIIFIKLHTHGTQENNINSFFEKGKLENLFNIMEKYCGDKNNHCRLFYVSARQMYNVVKGLEAEPETDVENLLEYELKLQY